MSNELHLPQGDIAARGVTRMRAGVSLDQVKQAAANNSYDEAIGVDAQGRYHVIDLGREAYIKAKIGSDQAIKKGIPATINGVEMTVIHVDDESNNLTEGWDEGWVGVRKVDPMMIGTGGPAIALGEAWRATRKPGNRAAINKLSDD